MAVLCCCCVVAVAVAVAVVVVCTVCARSTPICFQATRSMESDNIARTRGHSLHDEHPWVKTVHAMLS